MESLRICFIILLYHAHLDSAQNVMASVGDMATLFCTYSASEGTASMCWGRGICPISKCNDVIIWTDGIKVTTKPSEKYQLFGDIEKGNVSLTINRVTIGDEGTYCCRVEIPGIFNDIKKEITVEIQAPKNTTTAMTTSSSYTKVSVAENSSLFLETSTSENSSQIFKMMENSETPVQDAGENNTSHIIAGIVLAITFVLLISMILYRCKYVYICSIVFSCH
uniref:Ig-like domain-containing protein n=1 Tax=Leptobrachium leishanense TaxID=445787 RepID=A0A8C5MMU1_9ANUR